MSAIAGGVGIGAGVGVSSVALAPFNAANTFMGSAFFGYGMILGERYMYQADWPKIQARLENGEQIENIIQEYTGTFTAVVMAEARIIFDTVTREFIEIMKQALIGLSPEQPIDPNPTLGRDDPRRPPPQHTITPPIVTTPPGFTPPTITTPPPGVITPTRETKKITITVTMAGSQSKRPTMFERETTAKNWFLLSHPHGSPTITSMVIGSNIGWSTGISKWFFTATIHYTYTIGKT